MHILEVYLKLRELRKHQLNVFQTWFLDHENPLLASLSVMTACIQVFIIGLLVLHSLENAVINTEWSIIAIMVATSLFFVFQCYKQAKSSWSFFQLTDRMDATKHHVLYIDLFINVGLAIVIPIFNVYFLLSSETVVDAVLNSTALFFVLEIDDYVAPPWGEDRFMDELAINYHDYIMEETPLPVVTRTTLFVPYENKCVYVITPKRSTEVTRLVRQETRIHALSSGVRVVLIDAENVVHTMEYEVSGPESEQLLEMVGQMHCCRRYGDIHD